MLWNTDIDVYNPKVIPLSVARNIAWYLEIPDLLNFSLTSKNAYRAANDPALWVLKLTAMGVWNTAIVARKEDLVDCKFETLDSPLTCLDTIYKLPRIARFQVLKIRSCLHEYYGDLLLNVPYEKLKIFKNFHTPQDQAKILSNLLKFNTIDSDEGRKAFVRSKITDLVEIFENALLRELEIHFDIQDYEKTQQFVLILIGLQNHQTLIDFFLQKTCFDNESTKFLHLEGFSVDDFYKREEKVADKEVAEEVAEENEWKEEEEEESKAEAAQPEEPKWIIDEEKIDEFITELADVFNEEARIIDLMFPQSVAMMYKVSEELISNQLQEIILLLTSASKERGLYLDLISHLYYKLTHSFLQQLKPSQNVGESYLTLIRELLDASYESFAAEYMNEEKLAFRVFCSENMTKWKENVARREQETKRNILKHVKVETKNDFLTSFKKVFSISGATSKADSEESEDNYSAMQAKAKILAANIKSMNEVFSPELAWAILNEAKISLARLLQFRDFTVASVRSDIFATMQEEFINAIDSIGNDHLKSGFERTLQYLKDYNPKDMNNLIDDTPKGSVIEPLVMFFELINMADMIVQMLDIFYKEEMINRKIVKHENSVLNPSLQTKKTVEGLVDKCVADGLNVGIDVLFREIDSVFISHLEDSDYNPHKGMIYDGPTRAARRVVQILEDNIDMLTGSAEKTIVEVFQQEVAERFFQVIVKTLKRSTVSVDGAVTLISDLNLYYDFIITHIKSNKRMVFPLFQALKKVGSIYLIGGDESKAIGQLVSDLSKFNGIFSQEEIYEFVQRRQDWPLIKRDVEKVMYGLGLGDCTIM